MAMLTMLYFLAQASNNSTFSNVQFTAFISLSQWKAVHTAEMSDVCKSRD